MAFTQRSRHACPLKDSCGTTLRNLPRRCPFHTKPSGEKGDSLRHIAPPDDSGVLASNVLRADECVTLTISRWRWKNGRQPGHELSQVCLVSDMCLVCWRREIFYNTLGICSPSINKLRTEGMARVEIARLLRQMLFEKRCDRVLRHFQELSKALLRHRHNEQVAASACKEGSKDQMSVVEMIQQRAQEQQRQGESEEVQQAQQTEPLPHLMSEEDELQLHSEKVLAPHHADSCCHARRWAHRTLFTIRLYLYRGAAMVVTAVTRRAMGRGRS